MDAAFRPPAARAAVADPFHPWSPAIAPEWRSLERLGAEITELWGHLNAATCRFLELLAEFDRRRGWELDGVANCAHWLNWQCGVGAVAAREKVRVARALESLPKIAEVFRRGAISYSKVRAMTRVATPENEDVLLNVAEYGTASHVERLVRKYKRFERVEQAAKAQDQHRRRSLRYFYDEDGSLVIHGRLPAEVGAIVKKAIDAAVAVLDDGERERVSAQSEDQPATASAAGGGAPAQNVSAETSEADYERRRYDHDPWSAKRADALRLLSEAFLAGRSEDCGSAADRFQVVVHVNQRILAGRPPAPEGRSTLSDAGLCELENEHALALDTVRRLSCDCAAVGILENDDGEPLSIGRRSRSIPPALQRALKARDGGCRFPGCGRARFTEGHHVVHWADGGETKLANLVTLCRFHHRLVHEGGFCLHAVNDGPEEERFVFTRPDGTRVPANGRHCFRGNYGSRVQRSSIEPSDWPLPPDDPAELPLFALSREAGLDIHWRTSRCKWLGEPMDYGLAVENMVYRRDRAAS